MSRALRFPDLRTLYLDVLEQCARAAAQDRWLEAEIYQTHQLIRDAAYEDGAKPWTNDEYELADRPPDVVCPATPGIRAGRSCQSSMRPVRHRSCRRMPPPSRADRISDCPRRRARTTSRCWWAPGTSPCAAPAGRWRQAGCSTGSPARCSWPAISPIPTARRSSSAPATSPRGAATKIARGRRRATTNTARRARRRTSRTSARMPVPRAWATTCTEGHVAGVLAEQQHRIRRTPCPARMARQGARGAWRLGVHCRLLSPSTLQLGIRTAWFRRCRSWPNSGGRSTRRERKSSFRRTNIFTSASRRRRRTARRIRQYRHPPVHRRDGRCAADAAGAPRRQQRDDAVDVRRVAIDAGHAVVSMGISCRQRVARSSMRGRARVPREALKISYSPVKRCEREADRLCELRRRREDRHLIGRQRRILDRR